MNTKRLLRIIYILFFSITLYSQEKVNNVNYDKHHHKLLHRNFTEGDKSNHFNEYHPSILNNVSKLTSQSLVDSAISESTSGRRVKKSFTHNAMGKVTFELEEEIVDSKWAINRQTKYTYNDEGNKILSETENWIVNQWLKTTSIISNFDNEGNEISQIYKLWNGDDWINSSRNSILYDSEGNFIEYLIEVWSKTENIWQEKNKITVENDSSGSAVHLYSVIDGGYLFFTDLRQTITFDSDNREISRLYESLVESNWEKTSIDSTFYSEDEKISLVLSKTWNGSDWINGFRESYDYSQNENLIFTSEAWNGTEWIPGNSSVSIEDEHENSIGMYGSIITLYFSTVTDVEIEDKLVNNFELSQNYPNPFNPTTTISYSISHNTVIANLPSRQTGGVTQSEEITSVTSFPRNDATNVALNIYDVLGREVKTLVDRKQNAGNYEVTFNASNLPSGIYYYTLQSGDFRVTKKMVLQK